VRTSKIQELIDLYNSTDYYVAQHYVGLSFRLVWHLLTKEIDDIIIIGKYRYYKK